MAEPSRVPTSSNAHTGWSLETAIDQMNAVISEKHHHTVTRIEGNDRRYEERFAASQKALELGLSAQKSEISAALIAAERAVLKAEVAAEKRFESVNEFRATLADQQRELMPRAEVMVMERSVNDKLTELKERIDRLQAERIGIKGGWGQAVGVLGFVLALGSLGALIMQVLIRTP